MDKKFDVISIGEVMLRLSVAKGHQLQFANELDLRCGGAEANVSVALSGLGNRCSLLTKLPENPLGNIVINTLNSRVVDTSFVQKEPGRIGTYFVEYAAPPKSTVVYFDRKDSVASKMKFSDFDWDKILDTKLIHLTGIMAAISDDCFDLLSELIILAKKKNILVSFDINYRSKLWDIPTANQKLTKLVQDVDLLFCSKRDAVNIFGTKGSDLDIARQLQDIFNAETVITSRGDLGVIAVTEGEFMEEKALSVEIIDRVGAGDALAAGVIHGYLQNNLKLGLQYGVTLAAMCMCTHGDFIYYSENDVKNVLSNQSTEIQR